MADSSAFYCMRVAAGDSITIGGVVLGGIEVEIIYITVQGFPWITC